ncbi:M20/M25/M40 family metallo-hydrolase [Pseudoroseomonas wenyumeiae]
MEDLSALRPHLERAAANAWALMDSIGASTAVPPPGITRPTYGEAEELAAQAVTAFARELGLVVDADAFGNLRITRREDADGPAVASGSHLDSVPNGGNFDGLAGAAAAIAVLAAAEAAGLRLRRPLLALAMRGEESPWFGPAYIGSRLMLGHSTLDEIGELRRADSGRTLREHLKALGYPGAPGAVLDPAALACFLEVHIEQGPLLEQSGTPVGIASAIRGNVRFPAARCRGAYGHSAALPRAHRNDAVLAVADLALALDRYWAEVEAQDESFVATMGKFFTDSAQHTMTKVAGEVGFSLNVGSIDARQLDRARAFMMDQISRIEAERGVAFDLGAETGTTPVALDPILVATLEQSAAAWGIASRRMPTVGHDAAMFALKGFQRGPADAQPERKPQSR